MELSEYLYRAPALRLDLNQFAKVKAEAPWKGSFKNDLHPDHVESRLPLRILEGAEKGCLKTIRTRSDDLVFQTIDMGKKADVTGLEFWIQKKEKSNSKGNTYTYFVATPTKPI